jgi:5-(carboxyamino)imidazole ribonucleotide mutase
MIQNEGNGNRRGKPGFPSNAKTYPLDIDSRNRHTYNSPMKAPPILILLGSPSDREFAETGLRILDEHDIPYRVDVYSAHRQLKELRAFLEDLEGLEVIIAVAGLSAARPGVAAGLTQVPVVGVPRSTGPLQGMDALLSIAQMPRGVPVGTMAIGEHGMINGVLYALRILGLRHDWALKALRNYEDSLRR